MRALQIFKALSAARGGLAPTYTQKVQAYSPLQYMPFADASGSAATDESGNGRNGVYGAAKTLGQAGIGDGRAAVSYPGAGGTNFINLYSASFAGAFNGQEGSFSFWAQLPAAAWTDGVSHFLLSILVDANNRILIDKTTTNNQLRWRYIAGGTTKSLTLTTSGPTAFFNMSMAWSKTADKMIAYFNGVQVLTTQTGNGAWAGALNSAGCTYAASDNAGSNPGKGQFAHAAILGSALAPGHMGALAIPYATDFNLIYDGDSLTAGTGASAGNTYPQQVAPLLASVPYWHYWNGGQGGATIAGMVTAGATYIDPSYRAASQRNVCVVMGGGNDLAAAVVGTTVYNNIVTYCRARRAAGWKVVILPIIPRTGVNNTERAVVNTSIAANWPTFADGYANLIGNAAFDQDNDYTNLTNYNADQIHLTDAGYGIVAGIVNAAIGAL
jgi:lysophospholipase L1-like esterase